jgi:putative ABC transport system permease protein
MIRSYLKIAWRNISRSKSYSAINILGLATGLASFIIILLYLNYEMSYDKWDDSLQRVSKVSLIENSDIKETTPAPLASFIMAHYPGAEAVTSLMDAGDYEVLLTAGDKKNYQKGMVLADSSFLKVFPYKLTKGSAASALNVPNAVILKEEVSRKLFKNDNPIGKKLKINNAFEGIVTGVFKSPHTPSHMNVQLIARDVNEKSNKFWENYSYQTYLKTSQPVTDEKIDDAINRLYYKERLQKNNQSFDSYKKGTYQTSLFVDKVQNIHNFPKHSSSNFLTVSVLLALAILLLLAGAINFSNLSVAQSIGRAKEVGVRKVLGSGRKQLIIQFMG